ncbi:VOC family protein, partial [Streptomyces mirabilis]
MKSDAALHGEVTASHSVFGAPCWASLTTRDLRAAEDFYRAVMGWEWRTSSTVGDQYRVASVHGVPVAGVSEVNFGVNTAVAWTPYFAVASADETVSRSQERGGTTAVGPISFPPGRAALLADRDGAVFGIWEGELVAGWEEWRRAAPVFVRLHTRDAFDAAIFYAEVLEWASSDPRSCEVR